MLTSDLPLSTNPFNIFDQCGPALSMKRRDPRDSRAESPGDRARARASFHSRSQPGRSNARVLAKGSGRTAKHRYVQNAHLCWLFASIPTTSADDLAKPFPRKNYFSRARPGRGSPRRRVTGAGVVPRRFPRRRFSASGSYSVTCGTGVTDETSAEGENPGARWRRGTWLFSLSENCLWALGSGGPMTWLDGVAARTTIRQTGGTAVSLVAR